MSEHDWAPIAPPEDNAIICNTCLQCQCCSEITEECPGEWVPSERDFNSRIWLDQQNGSE